MPSKLAALRLASPYASTEWLDEPEVLFAGTARRFQGAPDRPVPHMGWNQLHPTADVQLLKRVTDDAHCYFVHSYALPVGPATIATCTYGWPFSAIVQRDNFMGTQFHPESDSASALDLRIFEEFLDGIRMAEPAMRMVA